MPEPIASQFFAPWLAQFDITANAHRPDTPAARSGDSSQKGRRETPAQLRQRFGIGWDNSPDYVLVSKAALKNM